VHYGDDFAFCVFSCWDSMLMVNVGNKFVFVESFVCACVALLRITRYLTIASVCST